MAEIELPRALEAEAQVIGAMGLSLSARAQVIGLVTSDMFHNAKHRVLFDAMTEMTKAGQGVDLQTIDYWLTKNRPDAQIHVADTADIFSSAGTSANAVYHARTVLEYYVRRQLMVLSHQLTQNAGDKTTDIYALADDFARRITNLTDITAEQSQPMAAIAAHTIELYGQRKSPVRIFPTGFPEIRSNGLRSKLDGCLAGGLTSRRLFLLVAQQTAGKTALLAQLAVNAAKAGANRPEPTRISVLTLEDSPESFVERVQGHLAYLDPAWAQNVEEDGEILRSQTTNKLRASLADLQRLPIQVGTIKQPTIDRVCSWMLAEMHTHKSRLFFIDHFRAMRRPRNMTDLAGANVMVEELAAFAKEQDVCILLAHHVNRESDRSTLFQSRSKSNINIIRRFSFSDIGVTSAFDVASFGILFLMNPWATEPPATRDSMHITKERKWPRDMAILGAMKGKNISTFDLSLKWIPGHAMFADWRDEDGGDDTPFPNDPPPSRPPSPEDFDDSDDTPF